MNPIEQAFEGVKINARQVRQKWPNDKDVDKTNRAFDAYDLGFTPLMKVTVRVDALKRLDGTFGVGERHIRRVKSIREAGSEAAALEAFAKTGHWSLEAVEHIVIRGVNADALERVWGLAPQSVRDEFMKRIQK